MTREIMLYLFISAVIGTFYFNYWYYSLQPSEVLNHTKIKRLIIYSAVILLSMLLSPASLVDLFNYYILKRKEEKQ